MLERQHEDKDKEAVLKHQADVRDLDSEIERLSKEIIGTYTPPM